MLTKSNYLLGLQCPNLLWVAKNDKTRIPEPDVLTQEKFKIGDLVGKMATSIFENGVDLSDLGFKENIEKTKEAIKEKKVIFEAGFLVDDLFSRGDILFPVGNKWDIIEVKSATKVKDVNFHDVAFQKYVYEKAGLKIRNCYVMHINNEYVKDGEIEPSEFLIKTDVTEMIPDYFEGIEKRISNMLKIINSKEEPKCSIGVHCGDPYDCSLKDCCWKDIPEGSVFEFYNMRKLKCFKLHDGGIKCLVDVPKDVKLTEKQKIQRQLALAPKESKEGIHKDKKKIGDFLKGLEYPIYYLDFETINPAIPKIDGMRPYQRIPFQFSLHIQDKKDGELKHVSFLAEGTSDPRPKFMQALKDNLGDAGSILVYNQGFEKGVLNEGCEALPEFRGWYDKNILPRIKDLLDVFRNFYYYDPKQKGSASIKAVLPVLSDLSYNEMEIGEGALASYEYHRVTFGSDSDICKERTDNINPEEVEDMVKKERLKVREALEKYCELDTMAEVEIVSELNKIIGENK